MTMHQSPLPSYSGGSSKVNPVFGETEDMVFGDVFTSLAHHPVLILQCVFACVLVAVLCAFLSPKTYEAATTVKVPESSETTQNALRQMAFLPSMGDPIETYVQVAQSKTVAKLTIESLQLTTRPEFAGLSQTKMVDLLLNSVQTTDLKESNFLSIKASAHDPQFAADLANAWAQNFILVNLELNRDSALSRYKFIDTQLKEMKAKLDGDRLNKQNYLEPSNEAESDQLVYKTLLEQDQESQIAAQAADPGIVVVDRAEVPEKPIKPQKKMILLMGLLMGLFLGGQAAFWMEKIKDRVKTEADLQRASGLFPLTVIPDFRMQDGKDLFSPEEPPSPAHLIENRQFENSAYQESFHIFRANLTFFQVDKKLQCFSIFSANPGEGKSLLNADLALSLSHTGKKVLLIDADFRRPSIGTLLGLWSPPQTGLPALLAGKAKSSEMIVKSDFENLWVMPNNIIPPNPTALLGSDALQQLIRDLKKDFDYIVIDGAPVLPVADASLLSRVLDGVVLMGRYNKTRRSEINRAIRLLRVVDAPLLGTVLNGVDMKKNFYVYGYRSARVQAPRDVVGKVKSLLTEL
jgi:capsular exopolysaccharide synthesis family protein